MREAAVMDLTHDELRKLAEECRRTGIYGPRTNQALAAGVLSLLDELAEAREHLRDDRAHIAEATANAIATAQADLRADFAATAEALGEAAEALDKYADIDATAARVVNLPLVAAALDDRRKAGK